jgi:serine-type D-Ala-D-Ala carboxypeptidase/endopeptidase
MHTIKIDKVNMRARDLLNPYADYSVQQPYQFLSNHNLRREVGSRFEYSNLGVGLLGRALSRASAMRR